MDSKTTCANCHLPHAPAVIPDELTDAMEKRWMELHACNEAQALAMRQLLGRLANPTTCNGCNAVVYFIRHANGANAPYTVAGLLHFVDCPERKQFARK